MKVTLLFLAASLFHWNPAGAGEVAPSSAPSVIHQSVPQYTAEALRAKLAGTVILSAVIGIDGVPSEIEVIRGLGLDEKAVECLKQWRFKPGTRDYGEPSPRKVQVEIHFRLPETPK